MTRIFRSTAILGAMLVLAWGASLGSGQAGDGIMAELDHNGSVMHMVDLGGCHIEIYYDRPRAGMQRAGVFGGTVLFEGWKNGNRMSGTAYVFRKGCEPAGYNVAGFVRGNAFTLRGAAPIRQKGGCQVLRYSSDSGNANLYFSVISGEIW
jgi:hypothetical protein